MNKEFKLWRLLLKVIFLFAGVNALFSPQMVDNMGKVSIYNWLVPGRLRFPYGENPDQAYNLSLFNLEATIRSHRIAGKDHPEDEYRVFVVGDSSIWGTLLRPEETVVGQINQLDMETKDGRPIRAYNLGYPTLSLTKDLLFLERSMRYNPDMVIWMVTLESFPMDKQLKSPIVSHNPQAVKRLIHRYDLPLDASDQDLVQPSFWDHTLIGQRRNIADNYRLQVYGVMWGITHVDQLYPQDYPQAQRDFEVDRTFHEWEEGEMDVEDLAYPMIEAGYRIVGDIPLVIVNEPVLISQGKNSDIRYNFYYPVWAYDQYRQQMKVFSKRKNWDYEDFWHLISEDEFTNTAIHLTPAGEKVLAEQLSRVILERFE